MTHTERTAHASLKSHGRLTWAFLGAGLVSLAAVVSLGFAGHSEAATAAGLIGAAAWTAGGVSVTVNVRR
ncbi:hypothetical protein [Streptomyces filamentosus]|uniref:hypothetical protein n=1 Tax=Streptomyces filamentosus TaxID=67294 RepID=UPI00331E930F